MGIDPSAIAEWYASVRPPLRWMGGKFRLRNVLASLAAEVEYSRLIDPFFGGGSSLTIFGELPFMAGDTNSELINFHEICGEYPAKLFGAVMAFDDNRETFYRIRSERPNDSFARAVRFLYLNRTAYGGIYRVNQAGEFNVPYGGGKRLNVSGLEQALVSHSLAVSRGILHAASFEELTLVAKAGDLLFIDPPYFEEGQPTFNRYAVAPFKANDHVELARLINLKSAEGLPVIATLPANKTVLSQLAGWRIVEHVVSAAMPRGEVLVVSDQEKWRTLGRTIPEGTKPVEALLESISAANEQKKSSRPRGRPRKSSSLTTS